MEFVGDTLILKQMDVYSDESVSNERTKSPREVHLLLFIQRQSIYLCPLMCFIMAPIYDLHLRIGMFKNNICIFISIQNYQKVNNIANCVNKSLLMKKACSKMIVVS